MIEIFVTYLYQPFLNLLVLFYWLLGQTPIGFDMGFAVIMLTLLVRIILLPLSLASHRTEAERREISQKVKEVEAHYQHDPVAQKKAIKRVLRDKPRIIISEVSNFLIQTIIALTLWRVFAQGLVGDDLHLIYAWMPEIQQPYNLSFLNRFDLTHPDWILNVIQALLIFIIETIKVIGAPYYVSRQEVIRVQFILPVISFLFFAFMPAGKKLFVITTLIFSLLLMFLRMLVQTYRKFFKYSEPEDELEAEETTADTDPAVS